MILLLTSIRIRYLQFKYNHNDTYVALLGHDLSSMTTNACYVFHQPLNQGHFKPFQFCIHLYVEYYSQF